MFLKRTSLLVALPVALVLASSAPAAPTPGSASLVIRHLTRGCHAWSVNAGAFTASQSITLRHGGSLVVTNNDVMPHTLVLTSGPALRIAHPTLGHMMGASLRVTLTRPGVYHFTTKAGADYPMLTGIKTIGKDNLLRLTVVVS